NHPWPASVLPPPCGEGRGGGLWSVVRRRQRRHHLPGEEVHRAHGVLAAQASEGERPAEVVAAQLLEGLGHLAPHRRGGADYQVALPDEGVHVRGVVLLATLGDPDVVEA